MKRTPVKKEDIAAIAKASRLDLSKERAELLVETVNGVFQMVDSLDGVEPGETAPANWRCHGFLTPTCHKKMIVRQRKFFGQLWTVRQGMRPIPPFQRPCYLDGW